MCSNMFTKTKYFLLFAFALVLISGCAEGMFWKTGYLSPWVRQQWSEEEQIAATLFSKRTQMREMLDAALAGGASEQQQASDHLAQIVSSDPILLLRIEATRLLGELPTETSAEALKLATRDREVQVRSSAVRALEKFGGEDAGYLLSKMAREDADTDVRIAATAALGNFNGPNVSETLSQMIRDPNPAMQLRAAESLARVTGQNFGADIQAWQAYMDRTTTSDQPAERVASEGSDSKTDFR